jgi:AMP deaminase
MVTNPSATNLMDNQIPQQFNNLPHPAMPMHPVFPAQAARMNPLNPSYSAGDIPALGSASPSFRPARTSSMIFSPGSGPQSMPPPQPPPMQSLPSPSGILRSDSNVNLDGSEPRIFPGVMSRNRRSSIQRPSSSSYSETDGVGLGWGRRSEVDEVIEESDEMEMSRRKPQQK